MPTERESIVVSECPLEQLHRGTRRVFVGGFILVLAEYSGETSSVCVPYWFAVDHGRAQQQTAQQWYSTVLE